MQPNQPTTVTQAQLTQARLNSVSFALLLGAWQGPHSGGPSAHRHQAPTPIQASLPHKPPPPPLPAGRHLHCTRPTTPHFDPSLLFSPKNGSDALIHRNRFSKAGWTSYKRVSIEFGGW